MFLNLIDFLRTDAIVNFSLGLSPDILNKRRMQNVITVGGQSASFLIEIIASLIVQLMIIYHEENHVLDLPLLGIFNSALMTLTFFIASPELQRFYFNM